MIEFCKMDLCRQLFSMQCRAIYDQRNCVVKRWLMIENLYLMIQSKIHKLNQFFQAERSSASTAHGVWLERWGATAGSRCYQRRGWKRERRRNCQTNNTKIQSSCTRHRQTRTVAENQNHSLQPSRRRCLNRTIFIRKILK